MRRRCALGYQTNSFSMHPTSSPYTGQQPSHSPPLPTHVDAEKHEDLAGVGVRHDVRHHLAGQRGEAGELGGGDGTKPPVPPILPAPAAVICVPSVVPRRADCVPAAAAVPYGDAQHGRGGRPQVSQAARDGSQCVVTAREHPQEGSEVSAGQRHGARHVRHRRQPQRGRHLVAAVPSVQHGGGQGGVEPHGKHEGAQSGGVRGGQPAPPAPTATHTVPAAEGKHAAPVLPRQQRGEGEGGHGGGWRGRGGGGGGGGCEDGRAAADTAPSS